MDLETMKNAIIVQAGRVSFYPNEELYHPYIKSRVLLICRYGYGEFKINNRTFNVNAGDYFLLPWGSSIYVKASEEEPFELMGNHIIPNFKFDGKPIEYRASHSKKDKLFNDMRREDIFIPTLEKLFTDNLDRKSSLFQLSEYIASWYLEKEHKEDTAKQLAQILINEILRTVKEEQKKKAIPMLLKQLISYIKNNLHQKIDQKILAKLATVSESTISRTVRNHYSHSTGIMIKKIRLEEASKLLISTRLRISEVAYKVGFNDIYYFSKQFKKIMNATPSEYRKQYKMF